VGKSGERIRQIRKYFDKELALNALLQNSYKKKQKTSEDFQDINHRGHREKIFLLSLCPLCSLWWESMALQLPIAGIDHLRNYTLF
jgi:hypothetical protein